MDKKNQEQTKEIPVGVKIISILCYLVALTGIIIGLFFLIIIFYQVENEKGAILYLIGYILIGIIFFITGRGLWKLRHWARMIAIHVFGLTTIFLVYNLINTMPGLGGMILNIILIWAGAIITTHLLFNKKVKEVFKE